MPRLSSVWPGNTLRLDETGNRPASRRAEPRGSFDSIGLWENLAKSDLNGTAKSSVVVKSMSARTSDDAQAAITYQHNEIRESKFSLSKKGKNVDVREQQFVPPQCDACADGVSASCKLQKIARSGG